MDDGPKAPVPHLGDHPHFPYWSPEPREASDETANDDVVSGDTIRLVWDYGVCVPLWDREGLLPDDPAWLREALGLSAHLIHALSSWGQDMKQADAIAWKRRPEDEWRLTFRDLDARAQDLVQRLSRELVPRYSVSYVPW